MDWKSVLDAAGPLIASSAPTIGGMIGGALLPGIGGGLGEAAGQLLASAFGVPATPEAVNAAIAASPPDVAAAKLAAAESEASAKWGALLGIAQANAESDTKQSSAINDTMKAELAAGQSWWTWRNLYGYSVTLEVAAVAPLFMFSMVFWPEVFSRFMGASGWLTGWYTLRFGLLGFIHSGSSNEKIAAVTGEVPGNIVTKIITAVKKK